MKILNKVSRFLLGLIFLIFGLNGFLHFIPMPPPRGVAGQARVDMKTAPVRVHSRVVSPA